MLPQKACRIDDRILACSADERGKWRKLSVPVKARHAEFLNAHICKDISCTLSNCLFDSPYVSQINYSTATTLLVFGIEGTSTVSFVDTAVKCTVRPGDVWLLGLEDCVLERVTPANARTRMTVIKYATKRLHDAFNDADENSCQLQGNYMIRLAIQQKPEGWIERLVSNKLLSVSDRLLAEARALELIAQWLVPINRARQTGNTDLKPVVELLMHNVVSPPNLEQLAKLSGMSHARLNREFKKEYGLTVFDWLRRHRIELAKNYLSDPAHSVTDIALNCGFSSASHFSQVFKTHLGMTPSEYRAS